jgi:hypothetical protein
MLRELRVADDSVRIRPSAPVAITSPPRCNTLVRMELRLSTRSFDTRSLLVTAPVVLTAVIIVIRAATQSITVDEASNYEAFVRDGSGTLWTPDATNHVLYSVLELFTTMVWGLHVFVVRLPALFGASLYLGSAFYLCRELIHDSFRRMVFLSTMCLNPLVLDFLIAARGYSLALGFLLVAVAVLTSILLRFPDIDFSRPYYLRLSAASIALGLAVSSNFAFASPAAVLGISFLVILYAGKRPRASTVWRNAAATGAPGMLVLFVLCGYTLRHWPSGQIIDGARTVGQLVRSVVNDSLYTPNGNFLQPEMLRFARWLVDVLPYFLALVILVTGAVIVARSVKHRGGWPRPTRLVALLATSTVLITVLVHAILRALFGTLLPEERTASWIVPMVILALAASVGEEPRIGTGRLGGRVGLLTLGASALAVANLCCLRLSYFQRWPSDADTQTGYQVLSKEAGRLHVVRPVVDVHFDAAFNFYRDEQFDPPVQPLVGVRSYPAGQRLYALYLPTGRRFIEQQHLVEVYFDPFSKMVIAEDANSARGRNGRSFT